LDGGDGVSLGSRSSVLDTESSRFAALSGDPDFFVDVLTLSLKGEFGLTLIDVFLEVFFGIGEGDEFLEPNAFSTRGGLLFGLGWLKIALR